MGHVYLVSDLVASRVSLLQNDYAAGLPSPLAFLGLVAAFSEATGHGYYGARVLPVLHSVTPNHGRTRPDFGRKADRFVPQEIPEDLLGHVEFSLFMDLPAPIDAAKISQILIGKRLAGGVIFNRHHGKAFRVTAVAEDGSALRSCRRGRVLIPCLRDGVRGHTCFGEADDIRRMRASLSVRKTKDNPEPGWRVPVAIGYRRITEPDARCIPECARDDWTPHVFAEPGAGVAELVSVRSRLLSQMDAHEFRNLFWFWSVMGRHITAHSSYNPEIPGV